MIDEAVEAPLQFPKSCKVILKLRETSFANEKSPFEIGELFAASRVSLAFANLRQEGHY